MTARAAAGSRQTPLARVLRWLARRDRSEREIRARLSEWGVPGEEAEAILATLAARGYMDDAALALRLCDWHRRHDPLGPRRLRERLRQRGIPEPEAERALAPFWEIETQRELAAGLLERRLPALTALPALKRWRRLCDYLNRRGFDADLVRELTDPLLAAGKDDPQDLEGRDLEDRGSRR